MSRVRIISISKVYTEAFNTYERAKGANDLDVQIRSLELMSVIAMEKDREKIRGRAREKAAP